jgi:hypothetical protein
MGIGIGRTDPSAIGSADFSFRSVANQIFTIVVEVGEADVY